MAVTVGEAWASREQTGGDAPTIELRYVVNGTDDDLVAKAAPTPPATYDGLPRRGSPSSERIGQLAWLITYTYSEGQQGQFPTPQPGDTALVSFDTGGGTEEITNAIQTVNRYAPVGVVAPDFGGAINVSDHGVGGVSITVPVFAFQETHFFNPSAITDSYIGVLYALTGRVNHDAFRGFAALECLLLGVSGQIRTDVAELTFRFAASPNEANLTVGPITGIAKAGWDYAWVYYEHVEDDAAQKVIERPHSVHIEQVYYPGNFALLGI